MWSPADKTVFSSGKMRVPKRKSMGTQCRHPLRVPEYDPTVEPTAVEAVADGGKPPESNLKSPTAFLTAFAVTLLL